MRSLWAELQTLSHPRILIVDDDETVLGEQRIGLPLYDYDLNLAVGVATGAVMTLYGVGDPRERLPSCSTTFRSWDR
jgi:hypothetical protein